MDANSVWYNVASVFVGMVALFGMAVMFVRAENIERNMMVGAMTVTTALLAGLILYYNPRGLDNSALFGIALLSLLGYAAGRVVDFYLGGEDPEADLGKRSFNGDLAD
jgi:hypothetical protein